MLKNKRPFKLKLKKLNRSAQSHPIYETDKGVVVTAAHPEESNTHSYLKIHHVEWGPNSLDKIAKDLPFSQNIPNGSSSQGVAFGHFRRLSTSQHVYVLAIGTTVPKNDLLVSVNYQNVPASQFQFVPGYNHWVTLVTAAARPDDKSIVVGVSIKTENSTSVNYQKFHHIQLIQYD